MNYLKRYLLENAAPESIETEMAAWRQLPEAEREPIHRYLGLTAPELDLYQRDPALFIRYLNRMKATRKDNCG